jgi:ATP-dependent helicase/nuclease subunit A
VEQERKFAVRIDGRVLNGSIDRLVWCSDANGQMSAEVLDFKTDDVPFADVPNRVEFYRPQIEAYCRAVEVMAGIPRDRITSSLIFTKVGHVERLVFEDESAMLVQ